MRPENNWPLSIGTYILVIKTYKTNRENDTSIAKKGNTISVGQHWSSTSKETEIDMHAF